MMEVIDRNSLTPEQRELYDSIKVTYEIHPGPKPVDTGSWFQRFLGGLVVPATNPWFREPVLSNEVFGLLKAIKNTAPDTTTLMPLGNRAQSRFLLLVDQFRKARLISMIPATVENSPGFPAWFIKLTPVGHALLYIAEPRNWLLTVIRNVAEYVYKLLRSHFHVQIHQALLGVFGFLISSLLAFLAFLVREFGYWVYHLVESLLRVSVK